MNFSFVRAAALAVAAAGTLLADFSHTQTTKIAGSGMMKVAGMFSRSLREPMVSTVHLKGDRMAAISRENATIVDLGKGTITNVDFGRKTYSVSTFEEMRQAMEKMSREAQNRVRESDAKMDVKVSVSETGATRDISGVHAREVLLTMDLSAAGTGDQNRDASASMIMEMRMWMARDVPGYAEFARFQAEAAKKYAGVFGGAGIGQMNPFAAMSPDSQKSWQKLMEESKKLEGIPVLQVVTTRLAGDASGAGAQQTPRPTAGEAVGGALGGSLGRGLGGMLSRKKKDQEPQAQTQTPPEPQAKPGVLMEMTTETSNFSAAPVDASKFEVPGGFKEVESEFRKMLKK
ncbi:MAG: hypothetical protein K2X35_06245 [Bryobacteraceae bacterium]|nr:hypothetical protein [Bryobacteraceae bacterium]